MSYAVYTTEAIVCGSKTHNTADKSFLLFTESTGMIYAIAKSVRNESSKQRYALQDFSLIRVSLIKGKTGWRIGSTEAISNPFRAADNRSQRSAVLQVINALRQFISGESQEQLVYEDAKSILQSLEKGRSPKNINQLTEIFLLRMFYHLGYIAKKDDLVEFIDCTDWLNLDKSLPSQATKAIAEAYKISHLG